MKNYESLCPDCSATGMGQFPTCKLKWDLLRSSVTACTINENTFSAPFGIFYVRTEICKEIFQKKSYTPPIGVLSICKLPFPNGSYRNGVCTALWAMSHTFFFWTQCRKILFINRQTLVIFYKIESKGTSKRSLNKNFKKMCRKRYNHVTALDTYKEMKQNCAFADIQYVS